VTINSVAFVSSTRLNVTVTVLATATLGPRDVTVTNPDAGVNTGGGVFTVNPAPTITTISPAALAGGSTNINVNDHRHELRHRTGGSHVLGNENHGQLDDVRQCNDDRRQRQRRGQRSEECGET